MALSSEQRRNAQILYGASRRPIIRKAGLLAGIVESTLRDLPYGDRDSEGLLQQRPSQGWGSRAESPQTDAGQFVRAAEKVLAGGFRGSAGALAQRVQRSAYPERYDQHSSEADALIRALGGSSRRSSGSPASGQTVSATVTPGASSAPAFDPGSGVDNSALLGALLSQPKQPAPISVPSPSFSGNRYLQAGQAPVFSVPQRQDSNLGSLLELVQAQGVDLPASQASEAPSVDVKVTGSQKPRKAAQTSRGMSPLKELFYNGPGGVNVDENKRVKQGFVSGHRDHVHVAAGPKTTRQLAELAQSMGLSVREFEPYDKVDPVHTRGSFHYSGRAFDASGSPQKMAAFSRRVARLYGL